MSLPRETSVVALAVLVALALTGCGPGELPPAPTPTSTGSAAPIIDSTPLPDEPVEISGIVIDGDSISVLVAEGGVLIDIPFTTAPATAIEQLSEAIGLEPITAELPEGACSGGTQTTWGALSFYYPYESAPAGVRFYAQADAKQTNNGITIATPSGHWVGYDGSDAIIANAMSPLIDYGPSLQVLAYDAEAGDLGSDPDEFWGASAIIRDDVLESIQSPIHYYYDC